MDERETNSDHEMEKSSLNCQKVTNCFLKTIFSYRQFTTVPIIKPDHVIFLASKFVLSDNF